MPGLFPALSGLLQRRNPGQQFPGQQQPMQNANNVLGAIRQSFGGQQAPPPRPFNVDPRMQRQQQQPQQNYGGIMQPNQPTGMQRQKFYNDEQQNLNVGIPGGKFNRRSF